MVSEPSEISIHLSHFGLEGAFLLGNLKFFSNFCANGSSSWVAEIIRYFRIAHNKICSPHQPHILPQEKFKTLLMQFFLVGGGGGGGGQTKYIMGN